MSTTPPAGTDHPDARTALRHGHTVSVSRDAAAQTHLLSSTLADALADGRSCVFIADRTAPGVLRDRLSAMGADVEAAEQDGRLTLRAAADTYVHGGCFEPERALDLLCESSAAAAAAGTGPMFVVGELTWLGDPVPGCDRLLEYEYLVNEMDDLRPCGIICVYDGATLPGTVTQDLFAVHPSIHSERGLAPNPSFSTEGDLAGSVRIADELEPPVNGSPCRYLAVIASAWADGELTGERGAEIDRHIASCPHCARTLRHVDDAKTALRGLCRPVEAPPGFLDGLRARLAAEA